MIEINLLPKEYQKSSRSFALGKTGVYVMAAAAGIVFMLVGITAYQIYQLGKLESDIEKARMRAAVLQQDIQVVDALIDVKKKISNRMTAVEKLDRNRSAWVRIMEDLAGNVPEFVWLGAFTEKAEAPSLDSTIVDAGPPSVRPVNLEGYAFTLNALAAFMINMMRSDYFDEVELVSTNETKFQENEKAYNFVLSCNVHYLSDEDLRNLVAQVNDEAGKNKATTSHRKLN